MLVVTSLQGQTEALTDYKDLAIRRRLNGEYSLSFLLLKTERNAHSYNLVAEESIIEYNGQEYRIKRINEKSLGNAAVKEVQATHVFFDLIDDYEYGVIGGNQTIDNLVSFSLTGTDFTYEIADTFGPITVFNFGEKNRLALVQEICQLFGAEVEQQGRHLIFRKQIGRNADFQFRFKHNLKTISREVDTSDLTTLIRGYGANGLVVEYRSPMADIYGERHAEPFKDEEITDQATLLERIKKEIKDEPNISFEIEFVELKKAGYPFEEVGLGDTVYVIYEPLGIDITARVVEYTVFPESPKSSTVVLANFRKTVVDVIENINNNVKETEKQVSLARSEIKQTNEQIQLTVTKTEELDGRLTTAESQITQQANQISLTVRKDGVISAINQSPEQIAISASKINLTGAVTISSLASDVRTTLDSKQDYFGVVSIINGTVTADYVNALGVTARWVSADSLLGSRFYLGKNRVSQSTFLEMWTGDNGAHYIKSNQASGFRIESTGSLSLQAGSSYGIYTNGAPLVANAGFRVDGGVAQFNTDIYMGNGTTIWAKDIWRNGSAVLSVAELQSWFASNNGYINSYGFNYNYLRIANGYCSVKSTAGGLQARDGSDSVYVDMYAKSFNPTSSIQWKKDIEVYTGNALDKILSAIPKMYRFNEDDESVPKRLGLIYEESPEEIQAKGSSAIDLYAMCTLLWKAVQELFNEIQSMKRSA
ncbi:phage tail spike protein [Geobacillus stearothermophilus]|uniref:phage tail spike protein n=1 Tax=Geobacillus stearothermophilus TaxID=1422 RepID=UPI002E20747C|nr:phage tail spike protein [Geobacillus stearothermophilus]MED3785510.1 phage tail spike protein [Geobacillus stearothermophilus]